MTNPYFEITKRRDINGRPELVACIYRNNDAVEFMAFDEVHNMQVSFDNQNQFLDRIREWGKALDIEVEENF